MSDTRDFFKNLKAWGSFAAAADHANHEKLPEDWWVIVTDVLGSTKAIEEGKYKQVNTIGGSTIMAIMNVDRAIQVPYVFGGDGATLAVPPCMEKGVREALLGAQQLARDGFGLDLRIGMVPVKFLLEQGKWVEMCKFQTSKNIIQASISGRGWEYAEELIKGPETRSQFEVVETADIKANANFEGFECRWKGVKSRKDHKICMLVQSTGGSNEEQVETYSEFFKALFVVYGNIEEHHPLAPDIMKLSLNPKALIGEAKVRTNGKPWTVFKYILKGVLINTFGRFLFANKIKTDLIDGSNYVNELISNSDYKKFDGMCKMVLDGSAQQQDEINRYLESQYQQGKLIYGTFAAREALMTCLIFSYSGDHAHFVDGSDGGYAMAAKEFKKRLAEFKEKKKSQAA
jgi:hypothetical protein